MKEHWYYELVHTKYIPTGYISTESITRSLIYKFLLESEGREPSRIKFIHLDYNRGISSGYMFDFFDKIIEIDYQLIENMLYHLYHSESLSEFKKLYEREKKEKFYREIQQNEIYEYYMNFDRKTNKCKFTSAN